MPNTKITDELVAVSTRLTTFEGTLAGWIRQFRDHVLQDKEDFADLRTQISSNKTSLNEMNAKITSMSTDLKWIKGIGSVILLETLGVLIKLIFG